MRGFSGAASRRWLRSAGARGTSSKSRGTSLPPSPNVPSAPLSRAMGRGTPRGHLRSPFGATLASARSGSGIRSTVGPRPDPHLRLIETSESGSDATGGCPCESPLLCYLGLMLPSCLMPRGLQRYQGRPGRRRKFCRDLHNRLRRQGRMTCASLGGEGRGPPLLVGIRRISLPFVPVSGLRPGIVGR